MKFTRILLVIAMVTQFGCKPTAHDCSVDTELETEFRNCLTIAESISKEEYGLDSFDTEQESKFIQSLEVLTRHKSRVQFNDGIIFYENRTDYKVDSIAWSTWYEKIKCTLTIQMAADTFDKYREPLPDYSDPEVLRRRQDLYPESMRDSVRYMDSTMLVKFQLNWPRKLRAWGQGASR